MRKGKLGIAYQVYAIIAFALAIFGQWLLCALLLGLVMVYEKDEWTTRQCMQAFFLGAVSMVANVVEGIFGGLRDFVSKILVLAHVYDYTTFYNVFGLISQLLGFVCLLAVFGLGIMGLLKVIKGQEANLPLLSKWAYQAYGYVQQAPPKPQPQQYAPQPQAPQAAQSGGYQPQVAPPPFTPQQPQAAPMAPPVQQAPVVPPPNAPAVALPPVAPYNAGGEQNNSYPPQPPQT